MLLLPELLTKPLREQAVDELAELGALLSGSTCVRPTWRRRNWPRHSEHRTDSRAADAVHLATAVGAGADRFLTNNRTDFPKTIVEIDITYPDELPDPATT